MTEKHPRCIEAAWNAYLSGEWKFIEAFQYVWQQPGTPTPQKVKSTDVKQMERDFISFVSNSSILESITFNGNIGEFMKEVKTKCLAAYTDTTLDQKTLSSLLQKPVMAYIRKLQGEDNA